jgi:hypothetical protein
MLKLVIIRWETLRVHVFLGVLLLLALLPADAWSQTGPCDAIEDLIQRKTCLDNLLLVETARKKIDYVTSTAGIRIVSSKYGDPSVSRPSERFCDAFGHVKAQCETEEMKDAVGSAAQTTYLLPRKVCDVTVGASLCSGFQPNERSGRDASRIGWVVYRCHNPASPDEQLYEVCGAENAVLKINCDAIARVRPEGSADKLPVRRSESVCRRLNVPVYKP